MKLSNFCRVGKAPLVNATGIQKNHKIKEYKKSQELDRAATGCFSCPNYKNIDFIEYLPSECQREALSCCQNCPQAVYKDTYQEVTKYVNEKNMYGNKPRLKTIAMKLLIVYHFLCPDDNGIIKSVSPRNLANYLGCTVRSILNANITLQKYKYIMYCKDGFSRYNITVKLNDYDTYALAAAEGGRGYATFSKEFLNELVKIRDINQLRILIRAALEADTNRKSEEILIKKDYTSLRRFLPSYCKPGIIKQCLSTVTSLFDVKYSETSIFLKMNPIYHGRRTFEKLNEDNTNIIKDYIHNLDTLVNRVNNAVVNKVSIDQNIYQQLRENGLYTTVNNTKLFKPFSLTEDDFKDLGLLITTYTLPQVQKAIAYIHTHYLNKFTKTKIGALARTILERDPTFSSESV